MVDLAGKTFGFVGTGTITEAIVTGLAGTELGATAIVLSPRNEAVSSRLAEAFANVEVAESNQDVLDRADIVFIAVRPQIVADVLDALEFRPDHHVISLVAATSIDVLRNWIPEPIPLSRAIPLPFVADLQGATAIYPRDALSAAIFSKLGTAVEVEGSREFDLLAAASALMGTYFGLLDAVTGWLGDKGLPPSASDPYMRQLFSGLAQAASARPETSFERLVVEHSTAGGLNEQVLRDF